RAAVARVGGGMRARRPAGLRAVSPSTLRRLVMTTGSIRWLRTLVWPCWLGRAALPNGARSIVSMLVLLSAAGAGPATAQRGDIRVHDPAIIKAGDTYYIFSTGRGVPI